MEAMLTKASRLAMWGMLLAAFLLANSVGSGSRVTKMSSMLSAEIAMTGSAADSLEQRRVAAKCAYMKGCTHHLGGHCLSLALILREPILSDVFVQSETLANRTGTIARIAFPTGLFRPPIV